jgi:tight adherence protein B
MPTPRRRRWATWTAATVAVLVVGTPSTWAAEGSIDHVENRDGKLEVLYSLPDVGEATPDLDSLEVTIDGKPVDATATLASDATNGVRRTAILAIDVSESMKADGKFTAAKRAAQIFLDTAPADLYVGIVTFAGKVTVAQEPSLDRAESADVIRGLTLSKGTVLYDGVLRAVSTSGKSGQRSVIVLSDGRDYSDTPLEDVTSTVKDADVKVDVVALGQSTGDEALLQPLSQAGGGAVISAADEKALGQVFAAEALTLAKQIQITSTLPEGTGREGNLAVNVKADGETFSDAAFVTIAADTQKAAASASTKLTPPPPGLDLGSNVFMAGLLALGFGVLVLLVVCFGGLGKKPEGLETTIAPYTRKGASRRVAEPGPQGVTAQAVHMATKALESNRGLEIKLGDKLEAGGLAVRPAEWLLIHGGIAFGAATVGVLLSGGSLMFTAIALLLGIVFPWLYLGRKQSKRLKAFTAQLAPTMQLMAGSLQAGLSLPQGMDTIVREGAEPMATEFRRALVETRLGVAIEDSLESIGERMMSDDFRWAVMAIRIQREVGGNLAELLLNVAGTLREREFLRRQVKSLSAEGRFSAYILLSMPPAILVYEFFTNREYLRPLYTTGTGYVMLGAMCILMAIGSFMMSRMIKLEI